MNYRVIVVSESNAVISATKLEQKVKELLEQGWKLQGGVSVSRAEVGLSFMVVMAQAMIKDSTTNREL